MIGWIAGTHARVGTVAVSVASVFVASCATALLLGCSAAAPTEGTSLAGARAGATIFSSAERKPLPDLGALTLAGPRLALRAAARHKILVLNVWASWCTECRAESPALGKLATRLLDSGVKFVGVDEQDTANAGRAFARSAGMNYPHLVDPEGSVLARLTLLPSYGIPSTLVVDRSGRMAARIVGAATPAQLRFVIGKIGD